MIGEGAALTEDQRALLTVISRDPADIASVEMTKSERIISQNFMEDFFRTKILLLFGRHFILGNVILESFT